MEGQMKKGILEMCILFQLFKKEMYGYEIRKIIQSQFPTVHESTIYTILRRLHSDGYTETFLGYTTNGPRRKYYLLTVFGKEYLDRSLEEWHSIASAVNFFGIGSILQE